MSDGKWVLRDTSKDTSRELDSRAEAEDTKQDLLGIGANAEDLEIIPPGGENATTDGGETESHTSTTVDDRGSASVETTTAEPVAPADLSQNPIGFLRSVNDEFVNTIKGTPAISKQGFRFIQREFEITTETKVVQWIDDPLGCVVWAKAELPSGYAAEAHGEGYQFEGGVSDNEFVRYADTRAKNRAISDLTSAGALAVSELQTK